MGGGEETIPPKLPKPASSVQEMPTPPSYADWSNSMQAYYGAGAIPPPYFTSTVASPSPHQYQWGTQHPFMAPYGAQVPYPAMFPPGGVYAHPNMAMTPMPMPVNSDMDGKGADGKGRGPSKKSKGSSAKNGDNRKAASGSGNDGATQSGETDSDGSSNGSDENASQQELGKKRSFDQMLADANAQNHTAAVTGKQMVSMPGTNMNNGMGHENLLPEQWIQNDRELKKQKRKQSNRESARRSRLRKQAECEELQVKVENLANENRSLREELQRVSEDCKNLTSENFSIKEELTRICGPNSIANLDKKNEDLVHYTRNGEGNS